MDPAAEFCVEGFQRITGVSLPVDQPTEFRLVRVDDEPRREGALGRLWEWLFGQIPPV